MKNFSQCKGIINLEITDEILLPCPFCGSINVSVLNTHTPYYFAECEDCSCQMHDSYSREEDNLRGHKNSFNRVIQKWNTRT